MLRNPRTRMVISLVTLVLVFVGWRWLSTRRLQEARANQHPASVRVVVASYSIAPRVVIDETMIGTQSLPWEEWQSYDAETRHQIARKPEEVTGRVSSRMILAGQIVRTDSLSLHTGLVARIPVGMRAMVVPAGTAPTHYHTGLLQVGDRIDIAATFNQNYSRVLLENVEVLAIDATISSIADKIDEVDTGAGDRKRGPEPGITVAVSPRQATIMALALEADPSLEFLIRPLEAPSLLDLQIATTARPEDGVTLEEIAPTRLRDPAQWHTQKEQEEERRRQRLADQRAQAQERASRRPLPPPPDLGAITERVLLALQGQAAPALASIADLEPIAPADTPKAEPAAPGVYLIRGNQIERVPLRGRGEESEG